MLRALKRPGKIAQQVELEEHFIDVAAEVGLPHLLKLSAA